MPRVTHKGPINMVEICVEKNLTIKSMMILTLSTLASKKNVFMKVNVVRKKL